MLQPSIWVCLAIILTPISGMLPVPCEIESERKELKQEVVRLYASSPGHTVFGEYVGGHWCPPCMDSASPSLTNLKSSNPDEFTYSGKIRKCVANLSCLSNGSHNGFIHRISYIFMQTPVGTATK